MDATTLQPKLIVTFRGKKLEIELKQGLVVREIKARVATAADPTLELTPDDIKLMYKGKILTDDNQDVHANVGWRNEKAGTRRFASWRRACRRQKQRLSILNFSKDSNGRHESEMT